MAVPFQPKLLVFLSVLIVTISLVLGSTVSFAPSPTAATKQQRTDSRSTIHIPSELTPGKENGRQIKSDRQGRTIMNMMDGNGVGGMMANMPNLFNMANLFKLNGTQFSWVPLGSLLFNNNGNIFGG